MTSIVAAVLALSVGGFGLVSGGGFGSIYVIAPSVSMRSEASVIMRDNKWTEASSASDADAILVVVRSSLPDPLNSSYQSLAELEEDADFQFNLSGPRFHVYVYRLKHDLSVNELKHISYDAESPR